MRIFRSEPAGHGREGWEDQPDEIDAVGRLHTWAAPEPAEDPALSRSRQALRAAFVAARPATRPARPASATRGVFRPRRFALAGATAALLLVGSVAGVLAESGPGQPFYSLRLDVEALTLPQPGTPARLDADLARAQARLDEAARAADAQDWNAEAAAVNAYATVVRSISGDGLGNGDAARLTLHRQLATLEQLRPRTRAGATSALDVSIASLSRLLAGQGGTDASPDPGAGGADRTPAANGSDGSSPTAAPSPGHQGSPNPQGSGNPERSPAGAQGSPAAQGSPGPKSTTGPSDAPGSRSSSGPNGTGAGGGSGNGGQPGGPTG